MQVSLRSGSFLACFAVLGLAAAPVQAQLGGLLRRVPQAAAKGKQAEDDKGGCPKGKRGSRAGRSILGGVIRDTLGDAASKAGVYSFVPIAEVSDSLTNAIACKLDPAEQVQAAAATEVATRGEKVGSTSAWTSETRENVSGSSTVVARNDEAGGRRCMNVTDFVIVEGEETRVEKRMCKEPGQKRYVLAEA
ncbi:MAG: hypothetical protein HC788_03955 [Sphingopyxis sp.]|nr:hypothetical protein [Sphingopyxis sp.]